MKTIVISLFALCFLTLNVHESTRIIGICYLTVNLYIYILFLSAHAVGATECWNYLGETSLNCVCIQIIYNLIYFADINDSISSYTPALYNPVDVSLWAVDFPFCSGSRQSPINIRPGKASGRRHDPFVLGSGFFGVTEGTLVNNGHTCKSGSQFARHNYIFGSKTSFRPVQHWWGQHQPHLGHTERRPPRQWCLPGAAVPFPLGRERQEGIGAHPQREKVDIQLVVFHCEYLMVAV